MNTQFIHRWFSDGEVKAICWTLIHSVWIGLIIAALAGLVIAFTRKAAPAMRYKLLCSLLALFVCVMGYTLIYEISNNSFTAAQNGYNPGTIPAIPNNGAVPVQNISSGTYVLNSFAILLNQNAGWLFAIWLICFIFKSLKLAGGMFYINRIRKHRVHQISADWQHKVRAYAQTLGVRKMVSLLQSELVKVPVTLGYFKPVIILPVGLIFQLSIEQVETVLWHELAHIRRRDYFVNIWQSVVEAVFFFNPAILWLSALIREEREACCDDMVLANVQHKGSYLEALIAFQGQPDTTGGLAMALSLRRTQLIDRLKRMVNKENKRLSVVEMSVLLTGVLLLSAFTFIPQVKPAVKSSVTFIARTIAPVLPHQNTENPAVKQVIAIAKKVAPDTVSIAKPSELADTTLTLKHILYKNTNGDKNNRDMNIVDNRDNRYHIIVADGKITLVEVNDKTVAEAEFNNYISLLKRIDAVQDNKHSKLAIQSASPVKSFKTDAGKGFKKDRRDLTKDTAMASIRPAGKKKLPADPQIPIQVARAHAVMDELVKAKIVADRAGIHSFSLSDTELYVNNQKQSQALQKKLKEAYGIKPENGLFYATEGKGVVFDKGDL
ncbi:M56 family metallopeptidase [Mucilaginibacter sp. UYCu711]|uniref:M56 family metallopeptidase n=1 Tax=Mucilaginibacter sp. UYCu711 TaxID=3156339 RepID=UPI003D1DA61A